MSKTNHALSHPIELKRIINLVLFFVIVGLIFQNSVYFKTAFQKLLARLYKNSHPNPSNNSDGSLPIFSENLIDFDDVNMVDKTRLCIFLIFCFIITIPFMV
ncbi:YNL146W [Saccharomyces arboricola H-6]|uniref:YNL146W n=1 Tax=Saccharomyces arboricola (strain H-6 / AS 2.3317 / CBS 10644) TaxID=1160507 RepID=J8PIR7_SACAR|nr:YNL146W [Saccharomyces arboricola H-6]